MADQFPTIEAYQTLSNLHDALAKNHAQLVQQYATLKRERDQLVTAGAGSGVGSPRSPSRDDGGRRMVKARRTLKRSDTFSEMKERHGIWHTISFEAQTFQNLQKLFWMLDTQQQGYITEASFSCDFMNDLMSTMGNWDKMKAHFDEDGNNNIDPDEFVSGFAKWCLQMPINTGPVVGKTIGEVVLWIGATINRELNNLVQHTFQSVKDSLAERSDMIQNTTALKNQNPIIAKMQVSDEIAQALTTQFDHLDAGAKGFIVSADLHASMQPVWQTMRHFFDEDGDDKVDRGEYFRGFMKYVMASPSGMTNLEITIMDLLKELGTAVNALMSAKIREFKLEIDKQIAASQ